MKKQKRLAGKAKNTKRYIGIDLHGNIFTACLLLEGAEPETVTLHLQGGGLEQFIKMLRRNDELAVEATGNSTWFRDQAVGHMAHVAVIAPGQFDVVRRSVKKTDKNDAKAIAFFLSKGMLPEARVKSRQHAQLTSAIRTRDRMVKQGVSHRNHVNGMCNGHGIKLKKKSLNSKAGFEQVLKSWEWSDVERAELEAIAAQLEVVRERVKRLEATIVAVAKTLPGFENLIFIKGIGALSAAVILVATSDIKDFRRPGNLAAYFGITPRVDQSNDSWRVGRITKRGSKIARTLLVQCAFTAIRYIPACATSIIISNPNAARARRSSPLPGSFSTRSSTRSSMAGCSKIFPISNLRVATNHKVTLKTASVQGGICRKDFLRIIGAWPRMSK